jgi:hypothetical protein
VAAGDQRVETVPSRVCRSAVLVIWGIGFLVRVGEGTSRSRWYRR